MRFNFRQIISSFVIKKKKTSVYLNKCGISITWSIFHWIQLCVSTILPFAEKPLQITGIRECFYFSLWTSENDLMRRFEWQWISNDRKSEEEIDVCKLWFLLALRDYLVQKIKIKIKFDFVDSTATNSQRKVRNNETETYESGAGKGKTCQLPKWKRNCRKAQVNIDCYCEIECMWSIISNEKLRLMLPAITKQSSPWMRRLNI